MPEPPFCRCLFVYSPPNQTLLDPGGHKMTSTITERQESLEEPPPPAGASPLASRLPLARLLPGHVVLATILSIVIALLAPGSATAHSSAEDSTAYVGTWTGRNGAVTLNSDGSGYLTISTDTAGGEAWSLKWSTLPGSILIELRTRAILDGAGLGGTLEPGTWWHGSLQRSGGVTVLRLVGPQGWSGVDTYWCNQQVYGSAGVCDT